MNKGIAMLIDETKRGLVELVNNKIQEGLPISVMDLILELVMSEVKVNTKEVLTQELSAYEQQQEESVVEKVEDPEIIDMQ